VTSADAIQVVPAPGSESGRRLSFQDVACVGSSIPEELVAAHGLVPVPITAVAGPPTPNADRYLEAEYGAESRSIVEQILCGACDGASLVVFDRRAGDLFYYVKEMVRLGWLPSLPPVHLFDLVLSRSVDATQFNLVQMRALDAVLARIGDDSAANSLAEVIAAGNAWRREVRRFVDLRWQRRISGVDALQALSRRRAVTRAEHAAELGELSARLEGARPSLHGPSVVLVSGEALYHDRLHWVIESAGGLVVGEDSEWGSRLAGDDVGEASLEALCDAYWSCATGPEVQPFEARHAWLGEVLQRHRPDFVVAWVPPDDTRFGWDYPRLAAAATSAGATPVLVRADILDGAAFDAAVGELSPTFKAAGPSGVSSR
jgi:benzoyl-CoA reductase/2-hydroxyglutaryl-CoA dehydratase subunit BcrC/BadD/HgdB